MVLTIPNILTLARIALIPLLFMTYFSNLDNAMPLAALIFIFAGITDWLDGYIAKNYNQSSTMGAILDPIADKCLIGIVTSSLAVKGLLPFDH